MKQTVENGTMVVKDYEVKIDSYSREFANAKERIKFKDLTNSQPLNEFVDKDTPTTITVNSFGALKVHNEHADGEKDYMVFVLETPNGKLHTSSETFVRSFKDMLEEIVECGESIDDLEILVSKKESKNFKGQSFMTCSLA